MSLYKQTDTRQEAVDPAVRFMKASKLLRCHPGHELQWDSPGQSAQVPKQDNRGTQLQLKMEYMHLSSTQHSRQQTYRYSNFLTQA